MTDTASHSWHRIVGVSFLILFAELACIRWFSAHVLYLTFFTNTMLLASFLGMSVGALAAREQRSWLPLTPLFLGGTMALAHGVDKLRHWLEPVLAVGDQGSPEHVFFGTEYFAGDVADFVIPIELLNAVFFSGVALAFVGLGQELGRALVLVPNRVQAYSFDILGSLLGIAAFAVLSWMQLTPLAWFGIVVIGLAYFLAVYHRLRWHFELPLLVSLLGLALVTSGHLPNARFETRWSPYYRVNFFEEARTIQTNLIGHQTLVGTAEDGESALAYAIPHRLARKAGRDAFENVLIIGAGSGNDVARALAYGAKHVDAVEIDPVIHELGRELHPDDPYADPRVNLVTDDGRNFLRRTKRRYDLVIYALVDSLVLHSSASSLRLESYLFTREALRDVEAVLADDGVFAVYNFFRQGWLVERLSDALTASFGREPVILTLPYRETIEPGSDGGFTAFLVGDTARLEAALSSPDGWSLTPEVTVGRSRLASDVDDVQVTDNWPFLYLRERAIPWMTWRSTLLLGLLAFAGLVLIPRKSRASGGRFDWPLFFLGAGFMLIETKAVVHMALLFGSSWVVNTIVFGAVLVTILLGNLFVQSTRGDGVRVAFAGLFVTLLAVYSVPLETFLGLEQLPRIALSSALTFAPILFAAMIFARLFKRTPDPDLAFGANVAGAMVGGLAEAGSMALGFDGLIGVAAGFYGLAFLDTLRR